MTVVINSRDLGRQMFQHINGYVFWKGPDDDLPKQICIHGETLGPTLRCDENDFEREVHNWWRLYRKKHPDEIERAQMSKDDYADMMDKMPDIDF